MTRPANCSLGFIARPVRPATCGIRISVRYTTSVRSTGSTISRWPTSRAVLSRPLSQPDKPQTERLILIVIRKLALALQAADDKGIVHRDLKLANIMVDTSSERSLWILAWRSK